MKFLSFLLPVLLFAALAPNIGALNPAIWLAGRWVLSGVLAVYAIATDQRLARAPLLLIATGMYVLWCLFTVFWSELPALSGAKVGALALVSFAGLSGGHLWIVTHDRTHALGFLWLATVLTIAASFTEGTGQVFSAAGVMLFAGATVNPNALGAMVALSLPFVVWRLYEGRRRPRAAVLWGAVLALLLNILYLSASRGAYLMLFGTFSGLLLSLKLRRTVFIGTGLAWLVLFVAFIAPEAVGLWAQRNIYKSTVVDAGVFSRREKVWEDSYDAAVEGGWTGLGFGVSSGGDVDRLGSFVSALGYGREKGNSQLAIVEETGLIGLGLYGVVILTLFRRLTSGFSRVTGDTRTQLGLVIGTLCGLVAQSTVEAWWVGPGSLECIFFWVLAGAGLGMAGSAKRVAHRVVADRPSVVRARA